MTSCILVGVFEELLFRVFVFNSILENNHKRIFSTMWVTSILFGLAHLSNLFYTDVVRLSILVQVLFAVGIGFLLQAVYLRTKSILFCISLHALVNYFGSYKSELYKIVDLDNLTYNFQDFLMSAGLILIFSGVFLIPLGYVLVRPILKKDL